MGDTRWNQQFDWMCLQKNRANQNAKWIGSQRRTKKEKEK